MVQAGAAPGSFSAVAAFPFALTCTQLVPVARVKRKLAVPGVTTSPPVDELVSPARAPVDQAAANVTTVQAIRIFRRRTIRVPPQKRKVYGVCVGQSFAQACASGPAHFVQNSCHFVRCLIPIKSKMHNGNVRIQAVKISDNPLAFGNRFARVGPSCARQAAQVRVPSFSSCDVKSPKSQAPGPSSLTFSTARLLGSAIIDTSKRDPRFRANTCFIELFAVSITSIAITLI